MPQVTSLYTQASGDRVVQDGGVTELTFQNLLPSTQETPGSACLRVKSPGRPQEFAEDWEEKPQLTEETLGEGSYAHGRKGVCAGGSQSATRKSGLKE